MKTIPYNAGPPLSISTMDLYALPHCAHVPATTNLPDPPLPPFEQRAEAMLARVFRGLHHVNSLKKKPGVWTCLHQGDFSSFDYDFLTRLVFGAHEYCLRVSISNGGPYRSKIIVTPRTREGDMPTRHPTIEQALAKWNSGAR